MLYRFNGELLKMRYLHNGISEISEYSYDHLGRKKSYRHSFNGVTQNVGVYQYDAIGRMVQKILKPNQTAGTKQTGSWNDVNTWLSSYLPTVSDQVTINTGHNVTIQNGESGSAGKLIDRGILSFQNTGKLNMGSYNGGNPLQVIDFSYHIRGSLKGINLDASGNLTNKLFSMKLGYEEMGYFDGNIGKQEWKSSLDNMKRTFAYNYDGSSRIKSGIYTSDKVGENYSLNNVNYDNNGNIINLSRNGFKSNNSFGLVDNLNYSYNINSHKILKIDDVSNETASFADVAGNDYTYWADGSLRSDANKGITEIEYNYLKRQSKITFANGKIISYQYDASGKKLKEIIGTQVTDYVGNTIYKNNALYQITHDEGRIVDGIYEYNITDHLGNLRVAFKDSSGIAKIIQSNSYGVWGEDLPTLKYINTPKINNFSYLNREFQVETGYTDLVNRQFDNIVGRFTSQDPIIEGQEHLSLYQYGWNNPVLRSDPDGLMPSDPPTKTSLAIHTTLDVVGLIPGLGEVADGANALIYLAEGNKTDAALSTAAMIPIAGWAATGVKAVRNVDKAVDIAKASEKTLDIVKDIEKGSDAMKNRVKLQKGTKEAIQDASLKKDGKFIDPNTGKPIEKGQEVYGHKTSQEWSKYKKDPANAGKSRKEVIKDQNDPNKYQIQDKKSNASHKYEEKQ